MPTATQTDQTESQEATVVRFIARCHDQVLTRRPTRLVDNGTGGRMELTYSEWIARQEDANLERVALGKDPLEIDRTPWRVEFANHSYETSDPVIIKFLRTHKKFETNGASGFYEEPPAPEDPTVALTAPMEKIAMAAAQDPTDVDALIVVLEAERAGLNRPAIINAAEAALKVVAEEPSELEADAGSTTTETPDRPDSPHDAT